MVPVRASFLLDYPTWQQDASNFFKKFASEGATLYNGPGDQLPRFYRMQFLYMASWFMVDAAAANKQDLVPDELPKIAANFVERNWNRETWAAFGNPKFTGMKARLDWRFGADSNRFPKQFKGFSDEDRHLWALAANLIRYERLTEQKLPNSDVFREIRTYAKRAYDMGMVNQPGDGVLMQPGIWAEYKDYMYAGNTTKQSNMPRVVVPFIGEDTIHAHRQGLWLLSMRNSYDEGSDEYKKYAEWYRRHRNQFLNHVLVAPSDGLPFYRLKNYMDGTNGMYRWGFQSVGPGAGWGPYESSQSLFVGWWSFVGGSKIATAYEKTSSQFPPSDRLLSVYYGYANAEQRSRIFAGDRLSNQFELIVRLASKIAPVAESH
jgi:hypothetical protein